MSNRCLYLIAAAMMAFGASSCSQEEELTNASGKMTTFKVTLEGVSHSRAVGEGMAVDNLYYEVYLGTTKILDNYGPGANADPVAITNGAASVDMPLLKGERYNIMFWAQNKDAIYNANNLQKITVDYTQAKANQEAYDAFFYGQKEFKATSDVTEIVLRRPFGQLNIGTTLEDWATAVSMVSGDDAPVTDSQIKVSGLAKEFDVLTGTATEDADDEIFQMFTLENDDADMALETFRINKDGENKEYRYLAMNYLLVPSIDGVHKGNVNVTATFRRGELDLFDLNIPNVPVQRNWRTNIVGSLLAADKTFEIVIDAGFDGNENIPDTSAEELMLAAANGGQVTLKENVVLDAPLDVKHDMIIDLNGYSISNTADLWNETKGNWSLISVQNGSTLTIKGEGELKAKENDCYAVDVKDGSTLNIEGGKYVGNISAIYVYQGTANVKGGEFSIQQLGTGNSYEFTLNCLDENYRNGTAKLVVTGGRFNKFNPADCKAEGANTNFVPQGYEAETKGDWTTVINEVVDYVEFADHAEVYTAEGMLQWLNTTLNVAGKENLELKLMRDVEMPQCAVELDAATGNYVFTETPITFDAEGVPSGSNWIPLNSNVQELSDGFKGTIDGNNSTISGIIINKTSDYTGLVGLMYDGGVIKNLTIKDAVIYGGQYTGIVGGRSQHGNLIENVHVVNSRIIGTEQVGGIVGRNYRRERTNPDITETLAYVKDCSTDADTQVIGSGKDVGGICGYNYGSIIVNCVNNADVTGASNVGGIVGYCRDYWADNSGVTVADAYVLACISTSESEVKATATNGVAGGIMGLGLADIHSHKHTCNFAVACHSASDITAEKRGSIVGFINASTNIIGCWAIEKDNVNMVGSNSAAAVIKESGQYATPDAITADIVNKMNEAIVEFNDTNAENVSCDYQWKWESGSWPILVPLGSN